MQKLIYLKLPGQIQSVETETVIIEYLIPEEKAAEGF